MTDGIGCSLNIAFFKNLEYIPDSGLYRFPLGGFSVCTQRQVKHQRCGGRTWRVQKNHNILRKNTIFNQHPVVYTVDLYGLREW